MLPELKSTKDILRYKNYQSASYNLRYCRWWVYPLKKSHEKTYPENLLNPSLGFTFNFYIKFLSNMPMLFLCNTTLDLVLLIVLF